MDLLTRLRALEAISRTLDPPRAEREALLGAAAEYGNAFVDQIENLPVYVSNQGTGEGLYDSPIGDTPVPIAELLALIKTNVDTPGINPASGGHLGYIPGGGITQSAVADYLAAITNRYAGVFFASPGAVRMENMLLDWMAGMVGYPAGTVGNLTSGGSIANLIGIVTARDARGVTARDIPRAVVYATTHAHHSLDKALRIAGLRECPLRHVPMDARYRMDADALHAMVAADQKAGLRPWLVIASAGTTDVGAIDPLSAIADVAQRHGLWFHCDGAYGAFFALLPDIRARLSGMERSDSIIMDPHKGLFLPYGSGAVLIKDKQAMVDAHYYVANYMQDTLHARDEASPADLSPELTKHFRGLRLWLPLKLLGVAPFRAALEEKLLLAQYFHDAIQQIPGFEVGPTPDLSVVTFRYVPTRGDADAFNAQLVQAIHNDGRVFLSSSQIDGRFTIRLAVLAFRTHLAQVDLTLDMLRDHVARLEGRT
ncbi:MAG: aminotransferase class V-fold PLP-dependent enzyme [Acidobacteria bacterium]|nr:aminotransferase class V-fold PLP-dependent enzyme [Acidobacteriota bacterium]